MGERAHAAYRTHIPVAAAFSCWLGYGNCDGPCHMVGSCVCWCCLDTTRDAICSRPTLYLLRTPPQQLFCTLLLLLLPTPLAFLLAYYYYYLPPLAHLSFTYSLINIFLSLVSPVSLAHSFISTLFFIFLRCSIISNFALHRLTVRPLERAHAGYFVACKKAVLHLINWERRDHPLALFRNTSSIVHIYTGMQH
ncbi:hypothetical protein O6H91_01G167000 [Diphasiastrum complanatum]|uniref:Uncharacterized protein n=1 Tax=Diphasiastrum complanatum TaxID=34168 RepID=A0ACC2EYH9_DIPCM|nr:hypothetical protein O6H91_01G167000 [Diphasiastrum complanatum]